MIVWWPVLYSSQMNLFAMKPPCVCKWDFDHSFFMSLTALCICFCVFWPFLVSLCLLTTPCIWLRKCCRIDCWCEPAQPTLTLPRSSQIVALPPSPLPSVVKSTNTKTKTHECEIQFDTYALSTMSLNWPMGDGYWLCLWNKTLQKTEVFLEFWSDLSRH